MYYCTNYSLLYKICTIVYYTRYVLLYYTCTRYSTEFGDNACNFVCAYLMKPFRNIAPGKWNAGRFI